MTLKIASTSADIRAGWVVSGLVALFLAVDGMLRTVKYGPYVDGAVDIGYPESAVRIIGLSLLVSTALYVIPRLALIGAILTTAYLGGAVASQLRAEQTGPIAFAIIICVLAWIGLAMRDRRVRALLIDG